MENWKRVSGVLCDRRMNVNIKGKVYRKIGTGVRGRYMGIEEGTGKEIGGRRNANATMDVRSYDGWKSKWTTKVGELAKKVLEMRLKMYKF